VNQARPNASRSSPDILSKPNRPGITMDFSIVLAMAAPPGGEGGAGGGILGMLPMFAIIFGIFYFMIIRPQQKRMKAQQALLGSVQRTDRVVLSSGLHGVVHEVEEGSVLVEIAKNVVVKVEKSAIQSVTKVD
jgi:preprotein translocase subunit YajC